MISIPVAFEGGLKVSATVDGRAINTDQPEAAGGQDSAPAPMDLFLGALATCTGFVAVKFCQARKIETEGLGLTLHCTKDEKRHLFTDIRVELSLPQAFPAKYQASILRALDQCTVKRHLMSPPQFSSQIV